MRPDFIIFAVALMAPLVEGTDDSKPFEPQSLPETVDIDTHDLWKRKGGSGNGGRGRGSRFAGGAPHYKHGSQNSFRSAIRKISYSIATRKKVDHLGGDTRAYPRSQPDRGGRALGSSPGSMLRYGALTPPKQYPGGSSDRYGIFYQLDNNCVIDHLIVHCQAFWNTAEMLPHSTRETNIGSMRRLTTPRYRHT